MLRRRRSLAGLIPAAFASSSKLDEDTVPPLPQGLARGATPVSPLRSASVDDHGSPRASSRATANATPIKSGLIRRVSSLFRSGSKSTGSPASARYRAAASTPDIRAPASPTNSSPVSPTHGPAKLVKRPSVKRKDPKKQLPALPPLDRAPSSTGFHLTDIMRTTRSTGAGISSTSVRSRKTSTKSTKSGHGVGVGSIKSTKSANKRQSIFPASSRAGSTTMSSSAASSTYNNDNDEEEYDPDADIRRPSDLGPPTTRSLLDFEEGTGRGSRADWADEEQHTPTPGQPLPRPFALDSAYASDASSSEGEDYGNVEGYEDDIRRPEGLGKPAALLDDETVRLPWEERFPSSPAPHPATAAADSPLQERPRAHSTPTLDILHALLGLPPPLASTSSSSSAPADPFATTASASASHPPSAGPPAAPWLWRAILHFASPPDAARAARVSRVLCDAARARLYADVDLRVRVRDDTNTTAQTSSAPPSPSEGYAQREEDEYVDLQTRVRRRIRRRAGVLAAVRTYKHLAARVEGVVCAGWPPWETAPHLPALRALTVFYSPPTSTSTSTSTSADAESGANGTAAKTTDADLLPFLRAHPTLERLAVVGGGDCADADDSPPPTTTPTTTTTATTTTAAATTPNSDDEAQAHGGTETEKAVKEKAKAKENAKESAPFLPRLTHLHAPAGLAVKLLERIAAAPFAPAQSAVSTPSASASLSNSAVTTRANTPNPTGTPPGPNTYTHPNVNTDTSASTNGTTVNGNNNNGSNNKQLSAASLALLAPDTSPKRSLRLSVWGRSKSHDRLAEVFSFGAGAGSTNSGSVNSASNPSNANTAAAAAPMPTSSVFEPPNGIRRGASANGVGSSATGRKAHEPSASVASTADSMLSTSASDDDDEDVVLGFGAGAVQLRRVESVGRAARPVFVQTRGKSMEVSRSNYGGGDGNNGNGKGSASEPLPHAHPLCVLRIAIPRPLYEGAAGVGGGRVGRAVAGVLGRGVGAGESENGGGKGKRPGLAVHLLFGPRVERRTLEKVLRTLGSGIEEGLPTVEVVSSSSSSATTSPPKGKTPPSAWSVARGRGGRPQEEEAERGEKAGKEKVAGLGVALLEVRSPVRVAELYKIVGTVLPRYPALRALLLTRPPSAHSTPPSVPPSPTPTFFPSPPSTPGISSSPTPSWRGPPSPSLRPPPSPSARSLHVPPSPTLPPPSPSLSMRIPGPPSHRSAPSSPTSRTTLAPPPLRSFSTSSATAAPPAPESWGWEWDGWNDAGDVLRLPPRGTATASPRADVDVDDDESVLDGGGDETGGAGLSREDAAHVAAWRRRCAGLQCVRMVSGSWWRDGESP
ncbi:hypothetical protein C8R46DRAFT_1356784 [Mycena filopes]|nr:hypothetical protein C8R46DRAFT_1356784 [Mycena filopes]